ncbi:MerR family DNA-binding transcriptional regulator [Saccharothrix saharensis]|uniref:MerR family DNA-binding transcriptional regulator n=1 Tax=Saccharothrix saharensis TaxID=571190 RepID=UPI003675098A
MRDGHARGARPGFHERVQPGPGRAVLAVVDQPVPGGVVRLGPVAGRHRRQVGVGQAAAFAGVAVKAVRHYHQHGLPAEQRRDSSAYRRYGSAELVRSVQVRALAAAGRGRTAAGGRREAVRRPARRRGTEPHRADRPAGGKP